MNIEKIKQVAWIGDQYLVGEIRGVVLAFHGLGHTSIKYSPDTMELEWAKAGLLVVFPYYGPWSWMNREARKFVDELVESIYYCYSLSSDIPLISTGGSMGGLSTLLYTRYAKKPVTACLALFPVCDLKYHFSERQDLPMSINHAFRGYKEDYEELFIEHSPLYQVPGMPDIPYLVVHGDKDTAVKKEKHSDPFVQKMRERKMNIEYIEVPGMGHGGPMPLAILEHMIEFVMSFKK